MAFEIVTPVPQDPPVVLPSLADGYEAFVQIEPEIVAMSADEVGRVTADVTRSCAIGLGAVPAILSLRPQIAQALPDFPMDHIDKLNAYIFAAYYAHLMAAPPARDVEKLQALSAEGTPLREDLLVQADALAHKGYFDSARVTEIRGGTGYLDLANDLIALSLLFRQAWSLVQGKTTVAQAECERADQLGRDILAAMGARLQPNGEPTTVDQAMDKRARAFTLFQRAYESCRRAATYLRWNDGDADILVPSIFTRPRSRRPAVEEPVAVAPAGANGGTTTTTAGA